MSSLDRFLLSSAFEVSVLGVVFLVIFLWWWRDDCKCRKDLYRPITPPAPKPFPRSKILPQ